MKNINHSGAKRLTMLAVLSALSLCMFVVENLFPPLILPGAKLGLGNVFSLFALAVLGPIEGLIVVAVRCTLGSLVVGNLTTLLYSLAGGLVSFALSALLYKFVYPRVSIVAISVCGAVVHNLVQNLVFCLVSDTPQMFGYMPYLALLGVLSGVTVGVAVWLALRTLPQKLLLQMSKNNCQADDFVVAD